MELAQSTLSASFIDKGARQLLLNLLGRLEHGQLLLRDGGERYSFGVAGTDLHAELVVQDPAFYRRLLLGGSIAAGETWVEGLWTSPDPVALVRLLARNLTLLDSLERRLGWWFTCALCALPLQGREDPSGCPAPVSPGARWQRLHRAPRR